MEESIMAPIDFSNLNKLSKKINEASDEITKALTTINEKLNALNLGVEAWCKRPLERESQTFAGAEDEIPSELRSYLGYGKLDGKWGLLVKVEAWTEPTDPQRAEYVSLESVNLLLSTSRTLRVEAIEHIPDLIALLEKEGDKITKAVSKAKELADEL